LREFSNVNYIPISEHSRKTDAREGARLKMDFKVRNIFRVGLGEKSEEDARV